MNMLLSLVMTVSMGHDVGSDISKTVDSYDKQHNAQTEKVVYYSSAKDIGTDEGFVAE